MYERLYRPAIGHLLRDGFALAPAAAFYALYILGVVVFAVLPGQASGRAAVAASARRAVRPDRLRDLRPHQPGHAARLAMAGDLDRPCLGRLRQRRRRRSPHAAPCSRMPRAREPRRSLDADQRADPARDRTVEHAAGPAPWPGRCIRRRLPARAGGARRRRRHRSRRHRSARGRRGTNRTSRASAPTPLCVCVASALPAPMRSRNTLASGACGSVTRLQRMPGPIQRQRDTPHSARLRGQATPAGRPGRGDARRCGPHRGRAGASIAAKRLRQRIGRHQRRLGRLQHRAADGFELHAARARQCAQPSRCAPSTMRRAGVQRCPRPAASSSSSSGWWAIMVAILLAAGGAGGPPPAGCATSRCPAAR